MCQVYLALNEALIEDTVQKSSQHTSNHRLVLEEEEKPDREKNLSEQNRAQINTTHM